MAFDFGGALDKVLDKGLDIWVDTEKARNYAPGAQTVGQRDTAGGTSPAGQPAMAGMPAWASNPAVMWGGAIVLVLLVAVIIKKL